MRSGSHVSVRGGDVLSRRYVPLNSSTIRANSGPTTIYLFSAALFSVSPIQHSLSFDPSVYRLEEKLVFVL